MKAGPCALACLLLCCPALFGQQLKSSDPSATEAALKTIKPEAIRAHMRFLSDSLLEGRAPDTRGYEIAARYVAAQLEGMGLRPGGSDGKWFQPVPLRKAVLDTSKSSLVLLASGKEQKLVDGQDYVLTGDVLRPENNLEAPIVFVGFGITAPGENYDDYSGTDVQGKIVLTFYGAPPRFASTVRAHYSDDVVKAKNALAHGAVAVLTTLLPEDWKRWPWDWDVPQFRMGNMNWLDKNGAPHDPFPLGGLANFNQTGAAILFTNAPRTLEQAFAAARAGQPQAFPLAWSARIHTVSNQTTIESPNVIGERVGSDPALRDQCVVYTAHLDHLGICPPINGDNVCHGALDNASGAATLLEIARAYASLSLAPRRSVLFVFVTGEEMGLLGSDYFAHFPTVPLDRIVANVNIDGAPGMLFPMKDVVAMGAEHSDIDKAVARAARQIGYAIIPDPMPEENGFIRSDQYSFVLEGIPAVNISDGITSTDPKIDGLAVEKKWLITNYHTPLDSMNQPLDYESAAKGAGLNFLVGYEIAQQDQPPQWNQGDFFGAKFGPRHTRSTPAGN
ncbi:MAG: M28 family peptidase [Candidatus Acidiferrales bacterium]